jgi:hypothetical protein
MKNIFFELCGKKVIIKINDWKFLKKNHLKNISYLILKNEFKWYILDNFGHIIWDWCIS